MHGQQHSRPAQAPLPILPPRSNVHAPFLAPTDKSGALTAEELRVGLQRQGKSVTDVSGGRHRGAVAAWHRWAIDAASCMVEELTNRGSHELQRCCVCFQGFSTVYLACLLRRTSCTSWWRQRTWTATAG